MLCILHEVVQFISTLLGDSLVVDYVNFDYFNSVRTCVRFECF